MTPIYHGSCLCGGLGYRINGEIKAVTHCHCSMCRKAHGAAFASFGSVRREAFAWENGKDLLADFASSPGVMRSFCRRCGSSLLWQSGGKWADWLCFALGSLDTPFHPVKERHVCTDSKAPWHEISCVSAQGG